METKQEQEELLEKLDSVLLKLVQDRTTITDTLAETLLPVMQVYVTGFGKKSKNQKEFKAFIKRTQDVKSGKIESDK